jgi:hypothetical protein
VLLAGRRWPVTIAALGLRWQTFDRRMPADGGERLFDVDEAEVMLGSANQSGT